MTFSYQSNYLFGQFTAEFGDSIELVYTYSEKDPFIEGTTIAYKYTDGVAGQSPVIGCRAAATQSIMNNLPPWMAMRQKHDSVGQQLAHSWGCNLENANSLFNEYRKDQFLETANVYPDIHMGVSELSFMEEKVYTSDFRNILYNSSFSFKAPARQQRPEGWTAYRNSLNDVALTPDSLFGNNAVKLQTAGMIKQTRQVAVNSGYLTFSCYMKTIENTGLPDSAKWNPSEAGLILVLYFADHTTQSYGLGFLKNTSGKWIRAGLTATITKEVSRAEVMIVNRTTDAIVVDLPMLERAKAMQPWTSSLNDKPKHATFATKTVTGVQVVSSTVDQNNPTKVEVVDLGREANFRDSVVPTRLEPMSPQKDYAPTVNSALGRQINFHGEVQPVQWVATDGMLEERSLVTPDKFGKITIADLYMDQLGDLYLETTSPTESNGVTVEALAATTVSNYLYVVTKETYLSNTMYCLKIVQPQKVNFEDGFLQSVADLAIPIELSSPFIDSISGEEVNRIGICKNIPGGIFIDTTFGRRFFYQLKFDYYYADFGVRKLYTRESYVDDNAYLQVI